MRNGFRSKNRPLFFRAAVGATAMGATSWHDGPPHWLHWRLRTATECTHISVNRVLTRNRWLN